VAGKLGRNVDVVLVVADVVDRVEGGAVVVVVVVVAVAVVVVVVVGRNSSQRGNSIPFSSSLRRLDRPLHRRW
jgi:hypothetical protein